MPVKQDDRVAGKRFIALQKGDRNSHIQLRCECTEGLYKRPICRNRFRFQLLNILRNGISAAPHFREQGSVRAGRFGFSAGRYAFL